MTHAQHEAICEILAGPIDLPVTRLRHEFLLLASIEADALEPLIDDMIEQAERRGRFAQLLEAAYANLQCPLSRK